MIGWLIAVLVVVFLLRTPVGVFLSWKDYEFNWKIRTGPFLWKVPEEQKGKKRKSVQTKQKPHKRKNIRFVGKVLSLIREHWQEVLELIGRVLRAPSIERLLLRIVAGGRDPAECAMNYGQICAGVSAVMPIVQHTVQIKKQQIEVSCSYEQSDTSVEAETHIILRFGELIVLAVAMLRLLISVRKSIPTTQKAV